MRGVACLDAACLRGGEARENGAPARNDIARKPGGELAEGALEQICQQEIWSYLPEPHV